MSRRNLAVLVTQLTSLVSVASLIVSSPAHADASAAVLGGVGLVGQPGEDLMGFGVGARGGYTWSVPFYLGGQLSIQRGSSEAPDPNNSMDYGGLDFGYQFSLLRFGVRPYVMTGVASIMTTRDVNNGFWSAYFGLGVAPHFVVWRAEDTDVFVGLDVRYVQSTTPVDNGDNLFPAVGVPLYLQLGAVFH